MNRGPDSVVRRYWRLRESLAAPKAAVYYVTSGSTWAEDCGNCGGKAHMHRKGVERCTRCGSQWPEVDGKIPKGKRASSKPRPGAYEAGFAELGTMAALIQKIPEPGRTVYLYHLDPARGGWHWAVSRAVALGVLQSPIGEFEARGLIRGARGVLELWLDMAAARGEAV